MCKKYQVVNHESKRQLEYIFHIDKILFVRQMPILHTALCLVMTWSARLCASSMYLLACLSSSVLGAGAGVRSLRISDVALIASRMASLSKASVLARVDRSYKYKYKCIYPNLNNFRKASDQ